MATIDRWPVEMQMIQESLVWLVPDAAMARTLVSEAGIPETFIDFGEPVWNRIKRIMVEAEKREMMPALLAVITKWYDTNKPLRAAKLAWEAGEDRRASAAALRKAAKDIPDPIAVAKITRKGDVITDVDVEVDIPEVEGEVDTTIPEVESVPVPVEEAGAEIPYSDEMQPGDWFSTQKTLADQERRISELEAWRRQLSIMPTPELRKP